MQFNEEEERCIKIIAKWFRENKNLISRSEAMKEFRVDDNKYDVLMKIMEHNNIIENIISTMDGYASYFDPSAYSEELAREFDEEDKKLKENGAYGEGKYGEGVYEGEQTSTDKELEKAVQQLSKERENNVDNNMEKNGNDLQKLSNAFIKFLMQKKGYHKTSLYLQERDQSYENRNINKGIRQYLSIFEYESQSVLAIVEFGLKEDDKTIEIAWEHFKEIESNIKPKYLMGYVVFPEQEDFDEEFTIIQFHQETEEMQWIFCDDFPSYEQLCKRTSAKTEDLDDRGNIGTRENELIESLISFLINEKNFPRDSLSYRETDKPYFDLIINHPNSDKILAILHVKSEVNESNKNNLMQTKDFDSKLGQSNPFYYRVIPSQQPRDIFTIFEDENDINSPILSRDDFPTFEQLLFAYPLNNKGRRIFRELIRIAKNEHGLAIRTPCEDYINLQVKKNGRTAAQIHRINKSDENIALVLAGYQEKFPYVKSIHFISRGEIDQLSGCINKYQKEINWLKGNLGHSKLKYKAGVYILMPESLGPDQATYEVSNLLELAKKNTENDVDINDGINVQDSVDLELNRKSKLWEMSASVYATRDCETEKDSLGFGPYVEAVAEFLVHEETKPPLTISIEGE